jgi:hypothetical protein
MMGTASWPTLSGKPRGKQVRVLVRKAFYHNGRHVQVGEQILMDGDDARGSMRSGLTAPIRPVREADD